jgi:hypothetical protein
VQGKRELKLNSEKKKKKKEIEREENIEART